VMAWVLYAPEDGSEPRSIETWIPFQMSWELPETQRDGYVLTMPMIRGMDARSTSARKIMVRANISVMGQALEPTEAEIFTPDGLDDDIQLLTKSYPMELAQEAGEKLIEIDEEWAFSGSCPVPQQILHYELIPEVTEQKVMAGRLVFRGKALARVLYSADDGSIRSCEREFPISQYTELDRDHSANATGWIIPVLTAMELEKTEDGKLQLKASVAVQYVIYDRKMLDIVEDAYSPVRSVMIQTAQLSLPVRLDVATENLTLEASVQAQNEDVVDVCFFTEFPGKRSGTDAVEVTAPGQFQVLYTDRDGVLHSTSAKAESSWELSSDGGNTVDAYVHPVGNINAVFSGDNGTLTAELTVEAAVYSQNAIPMVCGLELGEVREPEPDRPSLILRRAGNGGLWNIAKECGTTVDAICRANQLQGEPDGNKLLLIPIS